MGLKTIPLYQKVRAVSLYLQAHTIPPFFWLPYFGPRILEPSWVAKKEVWYEPTGTSIPQRISISMATAAPTSPPTWKNSLHFGTGDRRLPALAGREGRSAAESSSWLLQSLQKPGALIWTPNNTYIYTRLHRYVCVYTHVYLYRIFCVYICIICSTHPELTLIHVHINAQTHREAFAHVSDIYIYIINETPTS